MLKGNVIRLIAIEPEDMPRTRKWANDTELNTKILRVLPVGVQDQERWYHEVVNNPCKIVFAIKTVEENNHIGNTGFYHIEWIHRRAEFWLLIGEKKYWGQGIGSEVVSLMLDYAFGHLNLNKVHLKVASTNRAAIALYRKQGFHEEGRHREHYYINGQYIDSISMALLRKSIENEK